MLPLTNSLCPCGTESGRAQSARGWHRLCLPCFLADIDTNPDRPGTHASTAEWLAAIRAKSDYQRFVDRQEFGVLVP